MGLDSNWPKCIKIPFLNHFMLREGQNWVILPKTSWNSFETNSIRIEQKYPKSVEIALESKYDQNWTKVLKVEIALNPLGLDSNNQTA